MESNMDRRRRQLLGAAGATVVGLAGCLDAAGPPSDGDSGSGSRVSTSFFTLAEFTEAVAGDQLSIENSVPVGEHGHGWEPPGDLLPEIAETEAFVYLDVEGFQPWAEETADRLEADYETVLIDALAGIELLEYEDDHSHSHGDGAHDEIDESAVDTLEIRDRSTGDIVADAHADHWHGELPAVPVDGHLSVGAVFADPDGDTYELGETYTFDVRSDDATITADSHGDHVHLQGEQAGSATVIFELYEDGGLQWEAPPITVTVGEDDDTGSDDDHGHSHDHDHDHDHGTYDAKFFADPLLARQGIENIRDGLSELFPDHQETFEANADDYIDELETLHEEYEEMFADRERDVVVLAGHDSFRYLGERYGFEIHTPVGLSEHHDPSASEIADTLEVIEEHDIEHVLWDYFDGERLAEAIVEESAIASETLMVSPAESTTEQWLEAGYGGYLEQLREIALPAFATALGAE